MNGLAVLGLLLMIVPLQVLIHHMASDKETIELLHKTVLDSKLTVLGLYNDILGSLQYFSRVENLRELFVIPYRPKRKAKIHVHHHSDPAHTNTPTSTLILSKQKAARHDPETSPAREVEDYNARNVYFAKSKTPRTHRPPSLQYRVGDVVDHVTDEDRGVVIGWDLHCKASVHWMSNHGYTTRPWLISSPHYLLLVQSSSGPTYHYIPQDHLKLVTVQVHIAHLSQYFTSYSAHYHRYIPNDQLAALYPSDTVV